MSRAVRPVAPADAPAGGAAALDATHATPRISTWSPARARYAAVAVASAALTGLLVVGLGGAGVTFGVAVYLAVTLVALFYPAGVAGQVIVGQLLVAGLMVAPGGPDALLLVPVVAGVVATAELLAVVARLDMPVRYEPIGVPGRIGLAMAIAAGVFAAVALVLGVPGPTGIVAVVVAAGACGVMAARLMREDFETP